MLGYERSGLYSDTIAECRAVQEKRFAIVERKDSNSVSTRH